MYINSKYLILLYYFKQPIKSLHKAIVIKADRYFQIKRLGMDYNLIVYIQYNLTTF